MWRREERVLNGKARVCMYVCMYVEEWTGDESCQECTYVRTYVHRYVKPCFELLLWVLLLMSFAWAGVLDTCLPACFLVLMCDLRTTSLPLQGGLSCPRPLLWS